MYDPKKIRSLEEKQNDKLQKAYKYKRLFQKFQDEQHKLGIKIQALKAKQEVIYS